MPKNTSDRGHEPNRDQVARKSAHGATFTAIGAAIAVLLAVWYVVGAVDRGASARSHLQHRLTDTESKLANLETEFRKQTGAAPEQFETTTTTSPATTTTTVRTPPSTGRPPQPTTKPTSPTPTTTTGAPPATTPSTAAPPPPAPSTTTTTTRTLLPCVSLVSRCP